MYLQWNNSYHKWTQKYYTNDDYKLRSSKLIWYYEITVIIGYIMNIVVSIVPFIVYCVIRRTYICLSINWIWDINYDLFDECIVIWGFLSPRDKLFTDVI